MSHRIDPVHHRERSAEIAMRGLKEFSANDRCAAIIPSWGSWDSRPNQSARCD
jgi:hypothetical protein